MLATLKNSPGFSRLFTAYLISEVGSQIHRLALLVLVYQLTEEALWVSLTLAVQLLTTVVVGPLLSVWADRQDRRRLLAGTNLIRAPLVLLIPLAGLHSLPILLVIVFAHSVLGNLHDPVANAVIPELVPERRVDTANGLMLFARRFAEVAFVGLAGLLVAALGPAIAFWIDAVTYVFAGVLLLGLPGLVVEGAEDKRYWAMVREGIDHLRQEPTIRSTALTIFAAAIFGSFDLVLSIVLAVTVLKVGSSGFGLMEAAMALGAVLGSVMVPYFSARLSRQKLFLFGLLAFGLFQASVGLFPIFRWVVIAYLMLGLLNMFFFVPARSILQLHTPPRLRTRTFAAFSALSRGAVLFGTMLGGGLVKPLGAPAAFAFGGSMVAGVAVAAILLGGLKARPVPPLASPARPLASTPSSS